MPRITVAGGREVQVNQFPPTCPRCSRTVHPDCIGAVPVRSITGGQRGDAIVALEFEAAFQCPGCHQLCVGTYASQNRSSRNSYEVTYALANVVPRRLVQSQFPEEIGSLSESFTRIYGQAEQAEQLGLDEIAGPRYRKALEFLVKDFCVGHLKVSRDVVAKKLLGACISDHIDNDDIRDCARRAAWLGNDETHYERRWTSQDISDLKQLVQLTQSWILLALRTARYRESMPEGRS